MAIIRSGTFTVTASTVAQNVVIGDGMSQPTRFTAYDTTQLATPTNSKVLKVEWLPILPNGAAYIYAYTSAQPAVQQLYTATAGLTPFTSSDAQLWTPQQAPYNVNNTTNLTITGISQASQAVITATHSFVTADIGVTWVTFSQVVGMTQINTLRGQVVAYATTTQFTVNINSTGFTAYTSGGIANVITGAPATTQFGPQIIMTPQRNLGTAGLTFGTYIFSLGATSDVWSWIAEFDTPVNG